MTRKLRGLAPPGPDAAAEPATEALVRLLLEPLGDSRVDAAAGDRQPAGAPGLPSAALRRRVLERVARSASTSRALHTVRMRHAAAESLAPGVLRRWLYRAAAGVARRGEPQLACLIEWAPGAHWQPLPAGPGVQRDWLVVDGELGIDGVVLRPRDFHLQPAGAAAPALGSRRGAQVYLRESCQPGCAGAQAATRRDVAAEWHDYAPLIRRRVLWQHDGEAAMLYQAQPGARVPAHGHGHDEECLVLDGELFLDDVLLLRGDYQLAPAGSGHAEVCTEAGALIYAHGDITLEFRPDAER